MNVHFLKSKEKKTLVEELEERFGITQVNYLLFETGKEKIRGFSGTMSKDEIYELAKLANVEIIGAYLFKKEARLRLSLDATHLFASQIKKNIVQITDAQLASWLRGHNLEIEIDNGVYVLKHDEDFIGCGLSDGKKIINIVPKERRIRN